MSEKCLENRLEKHIEILMLRYPNLQGIRQEIIHAYLLLEECYRCGGKVLIAGNGGSAADSEHIMGELMKQFRLPRPVSAEYAGQLCKAGGKRGKVLAERLECPLAAIPLVGYGALSTALQNDVGGDIGFAQQLLGLGKEGDVFLGISTSGNSENIMNAVVVAKASGLKVVGLTGKDGGVLGKTADAAVRVPETETYRIQELHLPVYHCWCLMLEDKFYGK